MSNHLAIATVTACLQRMLQASVQLDIDGARVTTARPNNLGGGTPEKGINIYLYQTTHNHIWQKNSEVQMRRTRDMAVKKSRTALDLHFMLSFYGNEVELEPQRLLGSAVKTLSDRTLLKPETIQDTLADSTFSYLSESNLGEQVEEISFLPLDLSLEDLSKVWSVFFQTPYTLSIAYRASVIMIEGEEPATQPLPLRDRSIGSWSLFNRPLIEQITSTAGKFAPIFSTSTLLIRGKNLKRHQTKVRIGDLEVSPQKISETELIVPLDAISDKTLKAGVQSLQVIHPSPENTATGNGNQPPIPTNGQSTQLLTQPRVFSPTIESNAIPFILRPIITKVTVSKLEGREEERRSAQIKVRVNLTVGKHQRVVLAMNEKASQNPAAYLFEASSRRRDGTLVTIPINNVKPGEYLVRLQVDGAESMLEVDSDPNSPTYNRYIRPKMVIR